MKLAASVILRNEQHRYLQSCLDHLVEFCDQLVIWDNGSSDGWYDYISPAVRERITIHGDEQTPGGSLFINHAAKRQELCARTVAYDPDWILAIDADEFVSDGHKLRQVLETTNTNVGAGALCLQEVWNAKADELQIREDGGWNEHDVRLCWRPARTPEPHVIVDKGPATGRTPETVGRTAVVYPCVSLLHFGWVNLTERVDRHHRYAVADGGRYHSGPHLDSILWPDERITLTPADWPDALLPHRDAILASTRAAH